MARRSMAFGCCGTAFIAWTDDGAQYDILPEPKYNRSALLPFRTPVAQRVAWARCDGDPRKLANRMVKTSFVRCFRVRHTVAYRRLGSRLGRGARRCPTMA